VTINSDGSSNLDVTLLQKLDDYIIRKYPMWGTGTKSGTFRRLEDERPRKPSYTAQPQLSTRSGKAGNKSNSQSEETLEDSAEQFEIEIAREVYKKAIIKFETESNKS